MTRKNRKIGRKKSQVALRRLAADSVFPLTFFLRNMLEIKKERWWKHLSERMRRLWLMKMLRERVAIVMEVKKWTLRQGHGPNSRIRTSGDIPGDILSYCTNCGMCCETASGLPDFPPQTQIPEQWHHLFGDGLGKGHRFCPFLWESKIPRGSLCSIHPWRSFPCRIFEEDDCEFVRKDPDFKDLSERRKELMIARRSLFHLINAR